MSWWIYFAHSFKRTRPLKMQFFQFCNFFFSTLDPFSEKTYEKTSHFYNIFSNSISSCTHSRSFTLWIFFSKILWPFQFNGHFFSFPSLLREKFWKELTISWLIYKVPILMCTVANFCPVEIFEKNMAALSKPFKLFFNFLSQKSHEKTTRLCDRYQKIS